MHMYRDYTIKTYLLFLLGMARTYYVWVINVLCMGNLYGLCMVDLLQVALVCCFKHFNLFAWLCI
jgi:hypothetical protein